MEPVYELMAHLLTEHFGVPRERVRPEATFDDLRIGPSVRAEFSAMLEDELNARLPREYATATLAESAACLEAMSGRPDEDAEADAAAEAAMRAQRVRTGVTRS